MRLTLILLSIFQCGCTGLSYIYENYQGIELVEVATQYDTFRVFDKPTENKLMITPSLQATAETAFVGGVTLNPTHSHPKVLFQQGAEAFLAQSGRQCRITDGYVLVHPQWEFTYLCGNPIETSAIQTD